MIRIESGFCLALLLALAAGCGLSEPVLLSEDPAFLTIRDAIERPRDWSVVLAPVEVGPGKEGGDEWVDLPLDPRDVGNNVEEALASSGAFRDVHRGGSADLTLNLKILCARARCLGGNGNRIPWFLVWCFLSSIPSAWIADEDYQGEMEVEARLVSNEDGRTVWSGTSAVRIEAALDHFQRGISIWDFVFPGPVLAGESASSLSDTLLPHLCRKLELDLARRLSAEVPPPAIDAVVCIGCDAEKASFAIADAEAFAKAMRGRRGRRRIEILKGPGATVPGIRSLLEGFSRSNAVRIRDLVVYFAGCGTLLPADDGGAETGVVFAGGETVAVSELLRLVRGVGASSAAVLLDAGFAGEKGRTVPGEAKEAAAMPEPGDRIALMCACGPGETAVESEEFGGGLFTRHLLQRLDKNSDRDGDGAVWCEEIFEELAFAVTREARFLGGTSRPRLRGNAVLHRPAKRPPEENDGSEKPRETEDPK